MSRKRAPEEHEEEQNEDEQMTESTEEQPVKKKKKKVKTDDEQPKERRNYLKIDFRPDGIVPETTSEEPTYSASKEPFKLSSILDLDESDEEDEDIVVPSTLTLISDAPLPQNYQEEKIKQYYKHFDEMQHVITFNFPLNVHKLKQAGREQQEVTEHDINAYIGSFMHIRGHTFFTSTEQVQELKQGSRKLFDKQNELKQIRQAGVNIKKSKAAKKKK
jgi:hypothetical protein